MKTVRTESELRAVVSEQRRAGSIGFVPTMGALHEGHLSLVRLARARCDRVVASVFVNPTQFGPSEDFDAYPRNPDKDASLLEAAGVDALFLPTIEEMYPSGATTSISVGPLSTILEGAARPGHFDGVCTVVGKLFNLVQPDVACFGQKDAQQVAVIKKMVADLNMPVEIIVGETVREPDGLAMSSRNAYLDRDERKKASVIYRVLSSAAEQLATREPEVVEKEAIDSLAGEGFEVDYVKVVDAETFGPPEGSDALIVLAARLGTSRLIDNMRAQR